MFTVELVERKDAPKERGRREFYKHDKTGELLLQLYKGIISTCKLVILESGFCVLLALIALKNIGIDAFALVNERR